MKTIISWHSIREDLETPNHRVLIGDIQSVEIELGQLRFSADGVYEGYYSEGIFHSAEEEFHDNLLWADPYKDVTMTNIQQPSQ